MIFMKFKTQYPLKRGFFDLPKDWVTDTSISWQVFARNRQIATGKLKRHIERIHPLVCNQLFRRM